MIVGSIHDNIGLSAGQQQSLTIAQACVVQPVVLILDGATSSVATRTKRLNREAMKKLRVDRTSFVIAHRPSTLLNADIIACMERGDVVVQSSQAALMATGGRYWPLYGLRFSNDPIAA